MRNTISAPCIMLATVQRRTRRIILFRRTTDWPRCGFKKQQTKATPLHNIL